MRRPKLSRTLFTLVVLTAITVFTWTALSVYLTLNQFQAVKIPSNQLEPLNPKIDMNIISRLSKREIYTQPVTNSTNSSELNND